MCVFQFSEKSLHKFLIPVTLYPQESFTLSSSQFRTMQVIQKCVVFLPIPKLFIRCFGTSYHFTLFPGPQSKGCTLTFGLHVHDVNRPHFSVLTHLNKHSLYIETKQEHFPITKFLRKNAKREDSLQQKRPLYVSDAVRFVLPGEIANFSSSGH